MILINLTKIAWKAILLNKARAVLTMLGIIIGVAAVIAMLAIGEGSKESIKKNISSMGANMITIRPGAGMMPGGVRDMSSMQTLKLTDYAALKQATLLKAVSPQVNRSGQAIAGSNNWATTIYGVAPSYLTIREWGLESGAMFTDADVVRIAKLAVIGKTVQENLFTAGEDPIGATIRFNAIPFTVVGVLEEKGENTFGQDQDDIILAPYTAVQKRIMAQEHLQSIVASAVSEDQAAAAVKEATATLERTHKIPEEEANDFNVSSQQELINTFSSTSEMLTVLLVALAAISLLVGGIGIMNIMYVSVKERTREIGLRLAIGATERSILLQFLIESVLISISGGILGVVLGLAASAVVASVIGWPVSITFGSIVISFFVCTLTGIFFGYYPAKRGAALDPIQALRYE